MLVSLFVLHLLTYFTEAGPVALLELLQVKPMSRSSRWHRPNLPSVFTPTTPSDPGSLFCTLSLPLSLVIKQTLKKRILQVNLHLWSRYKKQRFFFLFFCFYTQNKTPWRDVSTPTPLLLSYSEGAFSLSSVFRVTGSTRKQSPAEREHMFLRSRQPGRRVAGGVTLLWLLSCCFDSTSWNLPGWWNMHPPRFVRLQTRPSSSPPLPHRCPLIGCCWALRTVRQRQAG